MDNDYLNVSHLAWCGLIALYTARRDGIATSPAQDNLFLTRWLAAAEKQRRFPRALASDISWLLKEGRERGLHADLPGKLEYLWRAGNGNLQAQNDLFRLQHALHAVKLTGWIYMVLAESEWSGRRQLRLSPSVSGIYLNRHALDAGFDEHGRQRIPLPARITGDLPALDKLLQRSGWRREAAAGGDPLLHHLLAEAPVERDDILRVLRAHPDNCIRAFHRGALHSTGRTEGRVLIRHYGGLVPDEIVLKPVMFLKVQDALCVTETWGSETLGGCTWRLKPAAPG